MGGGMGRRRPPVDQALPVTGLAVATRDISAAPEALDDHRLPSRPRRPVSGPAIAREAGMATGDRPGARWTAVLRRQPARVAADGQKAATPTCLRSSAATAVTIPAWTTSRFPPGCNWSVAPTRSRPVSPCTSSTLACTSSWTAPSAEQVGGDGRRAVNAEFQPGRVGRRRATFDAGRKRHLPRLDPRHRPGRYRPLSESISIFHASLGKNAGQARTSPYPGDATYRHQGDAVYRSLAVH